MYNQRDRNAEAGQSLVLLAIMLLVLIGVLALVLDGGNLYAKRRSAQNAADAGALAGARELCLTKDASQAFYMAQQYSEVHNGPTSAAIAVGTDTVTVTARITTNTYFAHLIGFPTATVEATAAAGCFSATFGESILPVAWACRPPIAGGNSTSPTCQEQALTEDQLKYYLTHPLSQNPNPQIYPELYVIMDAKSEPDDLTRACISGGGAIPCDLDGDGEDDLIANGDRSWLDLNGGGGGAVELSNWIDNGFSGIITRHTWLGPEAGVADSVFQTTGNHVGQIVVIPVFDEICNNYPTPTCSSLVHPGDTIVATSGGNYYYHIITFAAFYISCVNAPGVPGPECPGHAVARSLDAIKNNEKTIEGYFVKGIFSGLGGGAPGGGIDTGAYSLKLIR